MASWVSKGSRVWSLAAVVVCLSSCGALAADGRDAAEVQEVVVTAMRQERALDRVPLSISAVPRARMDALGLRTVADLVRLAPGVTVDAADNSIAVRGVDSDAGAATTGVYIDDTPIQIRSIGTNPGAALPSLFDLDRVEIIRGPQGTLFGAGAEGGAIRFITRGADLWRADGQGRVEIAATKGGGPSGEAGAAFGGPIVEGILGVRLSAWARHDGGFVDRVESANGEILEPDANHVDSLAVRAALAWAPAFGVDISPSILFQSRRANDTGGYWEGLSDPARGLYRNGNPVRLSDDDHFVLPALRAAWDLGGVELVSHTSYFYRKQTTYYDASIYNLSWLQQSTPAPLLTATGFDIPLESYAAPGKILNKQNNFTQELRLQSTNPHARLTWVAGGFWGRNRQRNAERIIDPQFEDLTQAILGMSGLEAYGYGLIGDASYIGEFTAYDSRLAVFGEGDFHVTDAVKLTLGLRISRTQFRYVNAQDGPYNAPGPSSARGEQAETPVTPRLGVSFEPDGRSLYYLTASKGYRIGGANTPLPPQFCGDALKALQRDAAPETYRSDHVWSWEAGVKRHTAGRRLEAAASVYRLEWNDIQQSIYLPACGFSYTDNLGHAVSQGFDLQVVARPTNALTVNWSLGYVDARYSGDAAASPAPGAPVIARKGNALPGPAWTSAVDADYRFVIAGRQAFVRAAYQYASRGRSPEPMGDAGTVLYDPAIPPSPATHFMQLRAGVDVGAWRVEAFMDNVLNAHPRLTRYHEDQETALTIGTTFRPRTTGVAVSRRF